MKRSHSCRAVVVAVVVDNYSTEAEASSIYPMAGRLDKVYKFTQNGLQ